MGVDRLGPLFPHEPCSQMPPPQPLHHVVLEKVHFGENRGAGEVGPVVLQELVDVGLYRDQGIFYTKVNLTRYLAAQWWDHPLCCCYRPCDSSQRAGRPL